VGRVSRLQAQANRQRVIAIAARMFREQGTAVSLADVMKAAGLTHGGFYKQFASKEDLVDEATAYAFNGPATYSAETSAEPAGSAETSEEPAEEPEAARRIMIERYLSVWHRDHAGQGCPVSGFAADLGREPGIPDHAREIYSHGVRNLAARLASGGDDGLAQLCTLVGALALARATRGNPLSEELLQAARTALTERDTGQART
jgi:TetR/AcrR family transcriptional repressor of nem operon